MPTARRDNWRIRRRVIVGALLYIAVHVSIILWQGRDTSLNQQAVIALISAGTAIIGSYVFGAAWDDNNKRRSFNRHGGVDPDREDFDMLEKDKE